MKTEVELVDFKGDKYKFRYDFIKSSCLAIVEFGKQNNKNCDFGIELIASHICREFQINPSTLIVFTKGEGDRNMMQFSEFYNEQCRVYSKDIIAHRDIKELI